MLPKRLGTTKLARMPKITTTTITSSRVKPVCLRIFFIVTPHYVVFAARDDLTTH
ncbi:Uncharacterised protein [Vibrio cholerae]|nr:Uncharacterised protein [Vibrio cholerae]